MARTFTEFLREYTPDGPGSPPLPPGLGERAERVAPRGLSPDDRRDPDASVLAEAILWPVIDFYRRLYDSLPAEIAVPLAVAFGRRLLAAMLDEAFGPARDTPPREEG